MNGFRTVKFFYEERDFLFTSTHWKIEKFLLENFVFVASVTSYICKYIFYNNSMDIKVWSKKFDLHQRQT